MASCPLKNSSTPQDSFYSGHTLDDKGPYSTPKEIKFQNIDVLDLDSAGVTGKNIILMTHKRVRKKNPCTYLGQDRPISSKSTMNTEKKNHPRPKWKATRRNYEELENKDMTSEDKF